MTNHTILPISWSRIEQDAIQLADQLRPLGPFKGLAAITRGGMAPALLIAQLLDIRHIDTIGISTYQDRTVGAPELLKSPSLGTGLGWLVIDDLADTGTTLKAIRPLYPEAIYAALYTKPLGKPLLDHYVTEMEQNIWLIFPWEKVGE